ncbi:DNA-3-methyladenine glycosylase [Candidatus Parcubacteria bacterium]|nr:DNA-3-methyladenine glycosylase [Patescibacteria group bacterium]MBU4466891.1 DNA-3-methyladenine glycosylase [Patescibacteria group bacterium]MCG2688095.1 DNA-3-methyladenine glycosylase [Candidatus Parcubacteria bacterium]
MNYEYQKIIACLGKDPTMRQLIKQHSLPPLEKKTNFFAALTYEIIGQQLSGKVARVIYKRFLGLFKGKLPKPKQILKTSDAKLRSCGCSWAKVKYLKSLAECVDNKQLNLESLDKLPDKEVYEQLLKVKGIGPWTAEMFMIFTLHRPDVFSVGDLGLRTAVSKLYKVKKDDFKKIEKIAERWKPYRSLACRYLWESIDQK